MFPSRRRFLQSSALAATVGIAGWPARAAEAQADDASPDLLVVNGTIHTVDERMPKVEAFAVRHGRFLAVGSNAEMRKLAARDSKVIDAAGLTVVPGFIDAHTHPVYSGIRHLLHVDCDRRSIAEVKEAIRQRAAKTPEGEWVFGFKFDDTKLSDKSPLTRADLDDAAPKHPVRLGHRGGHTAIYNSLALKLAGITKDTPDPDGGKFGRDAKGELTGFAAERAAGMVKRLPDPIWRPMKLSHTGVSPIQMGMKRMVVGWLRSSRQAQPRRAARQR